MRQEQAKHRRPSDVKEGNFVQKNTSMLALTTNYFKSHKTHCTRTKKQIPCVKTHLDNLSTETKDVTKKNTPMWKNLPEQHNKLRERR